MVIVMEKKALISGVLATMTVMTLMTVFCGGFLSRGQLVLPSTPPIPRTPWRGLLSSLTFGRTLLSLLSPAETAVF
jgi:hypothetical protein